MWPFIYHCIGNIQPKHQADVQRNWDLLGCITQKLECNFASLKNLNEFFCFVLGVDFINPGLLLDNDVVLGENTPYTHVGFDAYVDGNFNSATVRGDNLFKIWVFASGNIDGTGDRYVSSIELVAVLQ